MMKSINKQSILYEGLQEEDIKDIVEIEKATFSVPWTKTMFLEEIKNSKAHYILMKYEREIIGYIGYWHIMDEAHITNLAIKNEYRRNGLATSLLGKLFLDFEKKQIKKATLEVRESNEKAIQLYTKLGFISLGKRPKYYVKPVEDALILWKDIKNR